MISLRYPGFPRAILIALLLPVTFAEAGEWEITPRISIAEIYSDNIRRDDSDKESDLLTEIAPGISIHGEGARVQANLDYRMQNVFYLQNSGGDNVFHQLNANSTAEVARDFFFVDATSTMGQAVIDASDTASIGNLNRGGNRTDFYTYTLSPYIVNRFGSLADGTARYTYGVVEYDEGASSSERNRYEGSLVNGRFWGPLSWSGNYYYDQLKRDSSSDTRFEASSGNARYRINRRFSLVAQGGYQNNEFESSRTVFNGSYWAAGFLLQPTRYYSLEALTGNNLTTVTVSLYPTSRTALIVSFRDQEVGTNTGEVWSGTFNHRTRRTTWNATYLEDTTTRQGQQIQDGVIFLALDPITLEPIPNPQPEDFNVQIIAPIVSLTDETIERKRAFVSVGVRTERTGLLFSIFNEKRTFLSSLTEQDTKGFSGSLNRRLASRTNLTVTGTWQRLSNSDQDLDRDFWVLRTQLARQIGRKLNGSVAYRFSKQESSGNRDGYEENRIEARLTATF